MKKKNEEESNIMRKKRKERTRKKEEQIFGLNFMRSALPVPTISTEANNDALGELSLV